MLAWSILPPSWPFVVVVVAWEEGLIQFTFELSWVFFPVVACLVAFFVFVPAFSFSFCLFLFFLFFLFLLFFVVFSLAWFGCYASRVWFSGSVLPFITSRRIITGEMDGHFTLIGWPLVR